MKLKQMLAVIIGLLVASTTLLATDGSVTVTATSPAPNPVCLGSVVMASFSGSATNPTDSACEITITNRVWNWTAVNGTNQVASQTNGSSSWSFSWTPTNCGNQTATIKATVIFQGTNCNGSYSANYSGTRKVAVKVISVSLSMANLQRIGISANGHDRTKHFSATICPSDAAGNVTLTHGSHLNLSNVQNMGNGTITFDLVGTDKSTALGDTYVTATHSAGCSDTKTVTVIIPAAVGTPHPEYDSTNNAVQHFVQNATSSPSYIPNPPSANNQALTVNLGTVQSIPVVDQFGNACGDIYDGSEITENSVPINQALSGSKYNDPVYLSGIVKITFASDPDVAAWPQSTMTWPNPDQVPINVSSAVEVDGFLLNPAVVGRTIQFFPPSRVKITWP